ncbi:hypothetical protein HDU76_001504 [Blyttiomyces sp. JEL0837]|nr:hypothetical protein HDU76_001504 [Blyttiomyces sp. JEL0837]
MTESFESYPTLLVSGLPPTITEMDIVNILNQVKMETKVMIERDAVTGAPRVKLIFRYQTDGSKVQLTFQDPNMNYSTTSGAKTIVVKRIPLGVTSLDFYDVARSYGRIISCKVMIDRSGNESYALLQFENQDFADRFVMEMNGANFRGGLISLSWQFQKNAPYVYPTNRTVVPPPATATRASPVMASITGGVQVAVGAGWNMPSPPATPPTPPAVSPIPHQNSTGWSSSPSPVPNSGYGTLSSSPPSRNSVVLGMAGSPTPLMTGWHTGGSGTMSPTGATSPSPLPTSPHPHHGRSNSFGGPGGLSTSPSPTPTTPSSNTSFPPGSVLKTWDNFSNEPSSFFVGSSIHEPNGSTSSSASSASVTTAAILTAASAAGLDTRNLYVKNLDENLDSPDLFNLFRAHGRIVSARVMKDDATGRSKGFGFVSFENEGNAKSAMEALNGWKWGGKTLVICVAEPKGFREKKLIAMHGGVRY